MAEDAQFAIQMPGCNLWGQTFMKKFSAPAGHGSGEYTYTSELQKMQNASGGTVQQTEYFGYFHLSNAHNDSSDPQVYDKMHINGSNFGRDVLHCIHSQHFNPWSVMERFPCDEGQMDLYLIYACG